MKLGGGENMAYASRINIDVILLISGSVLANCGLHFVSALPLYNVCRDFTAGITHQLQTRNEHVPFAWAVENN